MTFLHKLGLYIALALAIFAAGLTTGFLIKKERIKTEIVEKFVEVRKQDAAAVVIAAEKDATIQRKQEKKTKLVSDIKKEVRKNAPVSVTPPLPVPSENGHFPPVSQRESHSNETVDSLPDFSYSNMFSNRDVWLLNSARAGTFDNRPEPSDAEGKAPSPVTREEFIDNDLDIIGQYHELAEIHNALVDEVERLQADQRKRLGITEK